MNNRELIDKLNRDKSLSFEEWHTLLSSFTDEDREYAAVLANKIAKENFGNNVYFRGIIEFTNYCKNDCLYCGIRCSNKEVNRYRLTEDEILECCDEGYLLGYRTFVLQGGEDPYWDDEKMVKLVKAIRSRFPDCAITLSLGERSRESYEKLYEAGADRYLLRHETADAEHYAKLHPQNLKLENRMRCLNDLKEIGYQTGCGMMIGSPYQTTENIVKDMMYIAEFKPHMIGIGPFLPHKDTPFRDEEAGCTTLTLFILSLCRIMLPDVLLPSTTALGTLQGDGRKLGVLAGCNVVMPNLSPLSVRKKYMLYDNKVGTDDDAKHGIEKLKAQMNEIGYQVHVGRGDFHKKEEKHD